jgi:hypothetical protein
MHLTTRCGSCSLFACIELVLAGMSSAYRLGVGASIHSFVQYLYHTHFTLAPTFDDLSLRTHLSFVPAAAFPLALVDRWLFTILCPPVIHVCRTAVQPSHSSSLRSTLLVTHLHDKHHLACYVPRGPHTSVANASAMSSASFVTASHFRHRPH